MKYCDTGRIDNRTKAFTGAATPAISAFAHNSNNRVKPMDPEQKSMILQAIREANAVLRAAIRQR